MARVSLLEPDSDPAFAELAETIAGQRRGKFLNIYKLLLHSPPLAEAWFNFNNAVRWGTELTGRLREIVIIRIAFLNSSEYTLKQHLGELAQAAGLTDDEARALEDWEPSPHFDEAERALLAMVDAMTQNVVVPDDVFEAVRPHYSERAIVELCVVVGAYNMHTRVFGALQADLEKD
ncbi:MAG: carboxymuconolactone decarboxylase family protein [Rhodospirillaceae bacterium]